MRRAQAMDHDLVDQGEGLDFDGLPVVLSMADASAHAAQKSMSAPEQYPCRGDWACYEHRGSEPWGWQMSPNHPQMSPPRAPEGWHEQRRDRERDRPREFRVSTPPRSRGSGRR